MNGSGLDLEGEADTNVNDRRLVLECDLAVSNSSRPMTLVFLYTFNTNTDFDILAIAETERRLTVDSHGYDRLTIQNTDRTIINVVILVVSTVYIQTSTSYSPNTK